MARQLVPAPLLARATPPTQPTPAPGHTFFDTTFKVVRTWDGAQWTLPSTDGGGETVVEGGQARTVATYITASLAPEAIEQGLLVLGKSFRVLRLTTDRPARVRLYSTTASRDADLARTVTDQPVGDHGLILDVVTEAGALSLRTSPQVDGSSFADPPTSSIALSITNLDATAGPVGLTVTYLKTEGAGAAAGGGTYTEVCPAVAAGAVWTVVHNLDLTVGLVQISRASAPYDVVGVYATCPPGNQATVEPDFAFAAGEYRIAIVKVA